MKKKPRQIKLARLITALLLSILLTSCFQAQRAMGCNNIGVFGCKDEPSEIQLPDPELSRAPSIRRSALRPSQPEQLQEIAADRNPQGNEYPWIQPLNECMAAGGLRTECFESLPPDILAEFEAWEAERATIRRRQFQQRQQPENSPSFGVETNDPNTED
jgi:hypothetical protein